MICLLDNEEAEANADLRGKIRRTSPCGGGGFDGKVVGLLVLGTEAVGTDKVLV